MTRAYAHTDGAGGRDHALIDHLRDTATRAHTFATSARPSDPSFSSLASWAGWLHDLGKYRPEFQDYLFARRPGGPDTQHAIFGAACSEITSTRSLPLLEHHSLSEAGKGSGSPTERRSRNAIPSLHIVSIRSRNLKRREKNHSTVESTRYIQ